MPLIASMQIHQCKWTNDNEPFPIIFIFLIHFIIKQGLSFKEKRAKGMPRISFPELKKYMDKRLLLLINANRRVSGILRGYDPFMNIVLDEAIEEVSNQIRNALGMVVIRGNCIVMLEVIDH